MRMMREMKSIEFERKAMSFGGFRAIVSEITFFTHSLSLSPPFSIGVSFTAIDIDIVVMIIMIVIKTTGV